MAETGRPHSETYDTSAAPDHRGRVTENGLLQAEKEAGSECRAHKKCCSNGREEDLGRIKSCTH